MLRKAPAQKAYDYLAREIIKLKEQSGDFEKINEPSPDEKWKASRKKIYYSSTSLQEHMLFGVCLRIIADKY